MFFYLIIRRLPFTGYTPCLFGLLGWTQSKHPLAWCTELPIKVDANMLYVTVAVETDPTLNLTAGVKRIGSDGRWFVLQHQRRDQSNCSMKDFCARRNRVGCSWHCRDDNYLSSSPAVLSFKLITACIPQTDHLKCLKTQLSVAIMVL